VSARRLEDGAFRSGGLPLRCASPLTRSVCLLTAGFIHTDATLTGVPASVQSKLEAGTLPGRLLASATVAVLGEKSSTGDNGIDNAASGQPVEGVVAISLIAAVMAFSHQGSSRHLYDAWALPWSLGVFFSFSWVSLFLSFLFFCLSRCC